ncbi:MAG: hypothetical protein LBQ89_06505 [Treponema sp.]|jgi:hypothetical protein|nr:hypothetical protein [Treponema sp.]
MKKTSFVFMSLTVIILAVSCASGSGTSVSANQGRRVDGRVPQFVRDAVRNAPEDALVGIGTARSATLNQSRTISATRARAELSRQMDTIIRDMVRDYTAGSEVDHSATLSFQENITVALSRSRLQGASVVDEDIDEAGNYWTVVMLGKSRAVQEINQAVSAAKLAVPAMASFNAEERMNQAFDRHYGTAEIGFSDRGLIRLAG